MVLSKFILTTFFCLLLFPAFAQENFLTSCKKPQGSIQQDIRYLKYFFKTKECQVIANELKKLKSFTEFMVYTRYVPAQSDTWLNDMPELLGLRRTTSLEEVNKQANLRLKDDQVFLSLELYSEFTNLKHIDLSYYTNLRRPCRAFKLLPHLETALVSYIDVKEDFHCGNDVPMPKLIVLGGMTDAYMIPDNVKDRIIGIENFRGDFSDLYELTNVKYLGIPYTYNITDSGDLPFEMTPNLTHLTLIITDSLGDLTAIGNLFNLTFLSINCNPNHFRAVSDGVSIREEKVECENPLTDISFLKKLKWLEHLDLSQNAIEDASPVLALKRLKSLNLSNNKIRQRPDLSQLKDLKHINFDNNPLDK